MPRTERPPVVRAYVMLLFAALFWAGHAVLARGVADHIPPAGFTFWRWLIACTVLAPIVGRRVLRDWRAIIRHWRYLMLLAWLGATGFNLLLYFAVDTTTATNALLINGIGPIFVVALAWLSFRQPFTGRQGLGIVFGLGGTLVIVARGELGTLGQLSFVPGDLLMLLAVLLTAAYTVLLRQRPRAIDDMTLLAAIAFASLVLAAPLYLAEMLRGAAMPTTWRGIGAVLYVAIFPSLLSYGFWNAGIRSLGANAASLFMYLIPVFGAGLAILFLNERLELFHLFGFALIAGGLSFATLKSGRMRPARLADADE